MNGHGDLDDKPPNDPRKPPPSGGGGGTGSGDGQGNGGASESGGAAGASSRSAGPSGSAGGKNGAGPSAAGEGGGPSGSAAGPSGSGSGSAQAGGSHSLSVDEVHTTSREELWWTYHPRQDGAPTPPGAEEEEGFGTLPPQDEHVAAADRQEEDHNRKDEQEQGRRARAGEEAEVALIKQDVEQNDESTRASTLVEILDASDSRSTFENGEYETGSRFQIFIGDRKEVSRFAFGTSKDLPLELLLKDEGLLVALAKILDSLKNMLDKWLRRQRRLRELHLTPEDFGRQDEYNPSLDPVARRRLEAMHVDVTDHAAFHTSTMMRPLPELQRSSSMLSWFRDMNYQEEVEDAVDYTPSDLADIDAGTPTAHASRSGNYPAWQAWMRGKRRDRDYFRRDNERIALEQAWRRREGMVVTFVRGFEFFFETYHDSVLSLHKKAAAERPAFFQNVMTRFLTGRRRATEAAYAKSMASTTASPGTSTDQVLQPGVEQPPPQPDATGNNRGSAQQPPQQPAQPVGHDPNGNPIYPHPLFNHPTWRDLAKFGRPRAKTSFEECVDLVALVPADDKVEVDGHPGEAATSFSRAAKAAPRTGAVSAPTDDDDANDDPGHDGLPPMKHHDPALSREENKRLDIFERLIAKFPDFLAQIIAASANSVVMDRVETKATPLSSKLNPHLGVRARPDLVQTRTKKLLVEAHLKAAAVLAGDPYTGVPLFRDFVFLEKQKLEAQDLNYELVLEADEQELLDEDQNAPIKLRLHPQLRTHRLTDTEKADKNSRRQYLAVREIFVRILAFYAQAAGEQWQIVTHNYLNQAVRAAKAKVSSARRRARAERWRARGGQTEDGQDEVFASLREQGIRRARVIRSNEAPGDEDDDEQGHYVVETERLWKQDRITDRAYINEHPDDMNHANTFWEDELGPKNNEWRQIDEMFNTFHVPDLEN
eukprot:GSA25T00003765001.1